MRITHLLVFVAGTIAFAGASTSNAAVTFTPIGTPTWEPVDVHLFSAPVGTAPNYPGFSQTTGALLPPPNHQPHPDLGIGPGVAHLPPYDKELANGVSNLGFAEKTVFEVSEFSSGNAVYVVWMNVPRAGSPVGSSPDFASGPIIPNSLFPIAFSGQTVRKGGVPFSASATVLVPPLNDDLSPPFFVDGHSHFPSFFFESFDFALDPSAGPIGAYEIQLSLTDKAGKIGWKLAAPFEVVPEPGTVAVLVLRSHRARGLSSNLA
jgi:hypothetical protein